MASDKKIQVFVKTVYGNDLVYPADDRAKLFTELTKQKTLSQVHLDIIKKLGFDIELVQPKVSLKLKE